MENLGDTLRRLATTRVATNGEPPPAAIEADGEPGDDCEICGGRGWFTPDVPPGGPEFGQAITCQCQEDRLREERTARLLRYSNLRHLSRFRLETMAPAGPSDAPDDQRQFALALDAATEYAAEPRGWLLLIGPHGSGKTHLAAAIANQRIEQGQPAFFVHVPDLLDHLRSSFSPASEISYSDLFERVKEAPMLILDGLGSQASTHWAHEKLQQIVNHRYNAELPTVVTTASELGELDPYLVSRLTARGSSRVLKLGEDEGEPTHSLGRVEPEMLRRMTFDTFNVRGNGSSDSQMATIEGAYAAAKNFAADPEGWLTLIGDTGTGKTHLAVAIAWERLNRGEPVFFAFVPDLLDHLRSTFSPDSRVTYDRLFDEVKSTPLLVLDDLGEELGSSPWAEEKLYQIVVYRHNARLPTIITSRMDFETRVGPISSRIRDVKIGDLVKIETPDYRIHGRPVRRGRAPARRGRSR